MRTWLSLSDVTNNNIHEKEPKIVEELNYIPTTIPITRPTIII